MEQSQRFLFGGTSCMAAALVTNPIDVIKVRMQLRGELQQPGGSAGGAGTSGYRSTTGTNGHGFLQTFVRMVQQEGVGSLYKGIVPSLLREASYSTLRMGLYEPVKDLLQSDGSRSGSGESPGKSNSMPLWKKIVAGGISGGIGAAIANPTDLVKVRMQAAANTATTNTTNTSTTTTHRYSSTLDAFRSIYRREGLRGLYRGTSLTTQRAILLTASQLPAYDHAKHTLLQSSYYQKYVPGGGDGLPLHLGCSVFAGLVCATTTAPVDLIKSRYMNQPFAVGGVGEGGHARGRGRGSQGVGSSQGGLRYRSQWDCLVKTVRAEGLRGLYKGWLANFLRIGPHSTVAFVIFEQLRRLAGMEPV